MQKFFNTFKQKNIGAGYLYFYIHLITEILCFYILTKVVGESIVLWLAPFIYDVLAFVPQSIIGYISDKHPKFNFCILGTILLILGFISFMLNCLPGQYTALIILSLGNACIHVAGAEVTLRAANGKLSHSAIFVSGGSFGVITGKLLAKTNIPFYYLTILGCTIIPMALLAEKYRKNADENTCCNFNYANTKINPHIIVILAVFIVIARGYMGYGIPTSWNKTTLQHILLYVAMGFGKAFGGILSDTIGIRKTALISILASLPFLLFGDKYMFISLFGILLFSMTMAITLALLVSVLKKTPGLAFGLTTIGLTLGTLPVFFIKILTVQANCILITTLTFICLIFAMKIIRKDGD